MLNFVVRLNCWYLNVCIMRYMPLSLTVLSYCCGFIKYRIVQRLKLDWNATYSSHWYASHVFARKQMASLGHWADYCYICWLLTRVSVFCVNGSLLHLGSLTDRSVTNFVTLCFRHLHSLDRTYVIWTLKVILHSVMATLTWKTSFFYYLGGGELIALCSLGLMHFWGAMN